MSTETQTEYVPAQKWQLQLLAKAADDYSKSKAAKHNGNIADYSEGVRDAFRILFDDLDPRSQVVMGEIYERYLELV